MFDLDLRFHFISFHEVNALKLEQPAFPIIRFPHPYNSCPFHDRTKIRRNPLLRVATVFCRGAFSNYVDNILSIIDNLPTPTLVDICLCCSTVDSSSTTYPPRFINVVYDRPFVAIEGCFLPNCEHWTGVNHPLCCDVSLRKQVTLCIVKETHVLFFFW